MTTHPSKKVFLCHSVFFAFIDRAHPRHTFADAYFRHFAENGYQLFSSEDQIIACYNNLRKHMSVTIAKEFLRAATWGNLAIIQTNESEMKDALKLMSSNPDPNYLYQNALASIVSYRRNIHQIVTFEIFQPSFGQIIFSLPF